MPKNLLPGESTVMHPLQQHWIVLVKGLWLPTLVGLILLFAVYALQVPAVAGVNLQLLVTLLVLAVWGIWAIVVYLQWSSVALTVTDQRVILEEGIFTRKSKIIPLDRVQDVITSQTLIGRALRYGLVEIDAASAAGREPFAYCRSPERLRDQVFQLSEQHRRG